MRGKEEARAGELESGARTICLAVYRGEPYAESRKSIAPRAFLSRRRKGL
jgi:hypothetical protein